MIQPWQPKDIVDQLPRHASPNHGPKRTETRGIILHSTRSGVSIGADRLSREYGITVNYFRMPAAQASAHYVVGYDEGQVAQMVDLDYMCWAQQEDNEYYIGAEFTQPLPTDAYSQWQLETGRSLLHSLALRYGFPLDRQHVLRHMDTAQGKRNGKSDPGDLLDIDYMLA